MTIVRALLAADERDTFNDAAQRASFVSVFDQIISLIAGDAWARNDGMPERFGL